jgi:transposase-like protein
VAAAHGLHPNLLGQWCDQALTGMASVFSPVELAEKKLASSLSRAERLALVEREDEAMSIMTQCELLSLHRSGVYYTPRPADERMLHLQRQIDETYTASPFYGIRKITAQLVSIPTCCAV